MGETFFTPDDIAEKFKVSKQAVNKWIREGKLKAVKLSSVWRIPESALQEFIKLSPNQEKKEG